jgi:hypothetical protein
MKKDLANFSTDLRRISLWLYHQNYDLANQFLDLAPKKYRLNSQIGCFNNIWDEIDKIKNLKGGHLKAAERALTLSSILFHQSL